MNLLYIIPEEYGGPKYGGVTAYTRVLARELQKRGHRIMILTPGSRLRRIKEHGLTICTIPLWYPRGLLGKIFYKISSRIAPIALEWFRWSISVYLFVRTHRRFDCIEAPEWGASTLFLPLLFHQRIIVRLHRSTMQYRQDNNLPVTLEFFFIDLLERLTIFSAHKITSPTKYMIDQYPWLPLLDRYAHRIHVIPNGVVPQRRRIKAPPKQSPTILFAGRLEVGKGCEVLVRAMQLFHTEFPQFRLIMIGEDTLWYVNDKWDEYTPHLRHMIQVFHLDEYIQILPKQSYSALEKYYDRSVMFVLPSFGHENCSMALLDAMRRNMPIVASDTGGTPEVLAGYTRYKLFRSGDHTHLARQMVAMMRDIRHTVTMSKQSVVNRFDIRITAKMTESLIV